MLEKQLELESQTGKKKSLYQLQWEEEHKTSLENEFDNKNSYEVMEDPVETKDNQYLKNLGKYLVFIIIMK